MPALSAPETAVVCRSTYQKHATLALLLLLSALYPAQLKASGGSQGISVSPALVNFGNQAVNTSQPQTITIVNSGRHTVVVQTVFMQGSGAFSVSNWNGPVNLNPSQTLQLSVVFRPTAVANYSGAVAIACNRNGSQSVPIQGVGVPAASAPVSGVQITTASLPSGQVGVPLTAPVSAVGGTQPYTWSVISGNLPGC